MVSNLISNGWLRQQENHKNRINLPQKNLRNPNCIIAKIGFFFFKVYVKHKIKLKIGKMKIYIYIYLCTLKKILKLTRHWSNF